MEAKPATYEAINILLHVIILFTFLSLFFFLYISKVEQELLRGEINTIVHDALLSQLEAVKNPMFQEGAAQLVPVLQKLQALYRNPDPFTTERNILVKFSSLYIFLILASILLTVVLTIKYGCGHNIKLWKVILENIVIFMLVAASEYTFFIKIAIKYVPTKPSLIIDSIIDEVKNSLKTSE